MSTAADFKAKGNKHLSAKEFDEAIAAYTEAINLNPKDHVFFSNRSAAYLSKGDASNALSDGERCVALNAGWAKGYTRKGAALHSLKKYDEAVEAYNAGLAIAPEDAGLKSGLAEVQKVKDSAEAGGGGLGNLFGPQMLTKLIGHPKFGPKLSDPAFMQKLQMMQKNPQLLMQDPEMMEVFQVLLGGMGEGGPGGAGFDDISPGAGAAPTPAPAASKKKAAAPEPVLSEEEAAFKSAKDKGNKLYKEKKFDEALAAYDEALSIDPTQFMVYNNKAAVYIEMNEPLKGIEICKSIFDEKAKGLKFSYEDKAKVYQRIAAAHIKNGDIPEGIKFFEKAQMENYDKAIERKIKTFELEQKKRKIQEYINPELGLEAKERGNTAFREGDFPTAIKEYEDATKRDPSNAPYHNNLAAAYMKMGVFNDAKRMVEKSLELDKTYVKAWAKKGDIEFFMKEYHKSMESYKAGLQLEPENSLCKQGLQKTISKINEANMDGSVDKERQAHAMADPEIQQILQDPSIRQILTDFQENPAYAQKAMSDPAIRSKIDKLISAGIIQVK